LHQGRRPRKPPAKPRPREKDDGEEEKGVSIRVGINGFGRIGMLTAKALMRGEDIEVVAVNDVMPMETLSLLFERDSTHGIWHEDVSFDGSILRVGEREMKTFSEREPSRIPWGNVGVDIVVESSGKFTSREAAAGHLEGGAKKVIVSAPAKGADATFISVPLVAREGRRLAPARGPRMPAR
jgi:glyceraldehyde 3-phosphate dehydrogenase